MVFESFVKGFMAFNYSKIANLGSWMDGNIFWNILKLSNVCQHVDPHTPYLLQKTLDQIQAAMELFLKIIGFVNLDI